MNLNFSFINRPLLQREQSLNYGILMLMPVVLDWAYSQCSINVATLTHHRPYETIGKKNLSPYCAVSSESVQVMCALPWQPRELLLILQHPSQAVPMTNVSLPSFLRTLLHIGQTADLEFFHLLVDPPPYDCGFSGEQLTNY